MSGKGKIDSIEKEKRIYQISLLLRRKPMSFIVEFMRQNWGLEKAQAYRYIASARKEWQKYYANIKSSGIGYHIAQVRDLKDKAFANEDIRLALDITKEEAKLMGIYPAEKHEITERKVIILGRKKEGEEKDKEEKGNE
uniref:Uncharacterized protein n=1 Tax=viral metagenome TaxID=1070528 RepID=A0A6H1ZYD0_9ZZZZ